jgi:hypothetical protein
LPNGGYEISVLTSSLFWKEAYAPTGHFLNVCDDNECLALPQIYHLRYSVSRGRTMVQWSATPNGDADCLFLLWYSSGVPVDPQQPPDKTLWYLPHQTEYQTTFSQKPPAYLTIAVMRPGNEPEPGQRHELFLDWKTTLARAPDDTVVLDTPLPAADNDVFARHRDESDMILWQ